MKRGMGPMPAGRLLMRQVREVLRLKHACGARERQIATSVGSGRAAVGECLRRAAAIGIIWPVPEGMHDAEFERRLFTPPNFHPPSGPTPDRTSVHTELGRRDVTPMRLWEECRAKHAHGHGYGRFCGIYAEWRRGASATIRQTHVAEEGPIVDFASRKDPAIDPSMGEIRGSPIFIATPAAASPFGMPRTGKADVSRVWPSHSAPRPAPPWRATGTAPGPPKSAGWLGDVDSNHDRQSQNLQSYH